MEIKNINTIAFYNIRLLLREKLLWFYTLGMYVVILFAQLSNQSILGRYSFCVADFSSSVPFMNTFFFLIFQTLPLVILSCHFLSKNVMWIAWKRCTIGRKVMRNTCVACLLLLLVCLVVRHYFRC